LALLLLIASSALAVDAQFSVSGDWQVSVRITRPDQPVLAAELSVEPGVELAVAGERYESLPLFDASAAGWRKGAALRGVRTQETTAKGQLVPGTLQLRLAPEADASKRWGRLWRQGIPYSTLFLNAINHPDARGMKLFADRLMVLFPGR
jgi:hypothetical protein